MQSLNNPNPPQWMLRFFRWFCNEDYVEDIEGDLLEKYHDYRDQWSQRKANWRFLLDVLSLFRPSLIHPFSFDHQIIHPAMLRQNLKISYRNLLKHKTYAAIKIGGLAIGVATFIIITLFVQNELSFDQHYSQKDHLYRLLNKTTNADFQFKRWTSFSPPVGKMLNEDYPEIEAAGRMIARDWYLAGDNQFRRSDQIQNNYEDGFIYGDPQLLDIFEIPMVYGDAKTALLRPKTLVLSKSKADQYFPNENPIGKTVVLNESEENTYTIGGVIEDLPSTTFLKFDFMITLVDQEFWKGEQSSWCCQNYDLYLRLKPEASIAGLEKKLITIRDDYMIPYLTEREDKFAEVLKKHRSFVLQPIDEVYLHSKGIFDNYRHNDIAVIRLFAAIALFILLLACINFINLFTAKSANRAKEVGVRKVIGSFRIDLIRQFLIESMLYSFVSVLLGAAMASLVLPIFNQLLDTQLSFPMLTWWLVPGLFALALLIGLFAGAYPSFYLSSFQPIEVLKGNLRRGSKSSRLRSSMVVFQFTISIILVVSATVVYNQMQFILHKDIGFDKERVLMIRGAHTLNKQSLTFKEELKKLPMVEAVTNSNYFPVKGTSRDNNQFWIEGHQKLDKGASGQSWWVAENYIPTMKINLLEGRNFSNEMASDSAAVIINQTMAEELGLDQPLGKQIRNWRTWNIIGVVEDFHFETMEHEIRPLAFFRGGHNSSVIAVKIKTEDLRQALTDITATWDQFLPNQPIRYNFMGETYAEMYEGVERTGNIFGACAILAILIACLGLFGLSTFMVEQRSKEVCVRKVLGASIASLYQLLTTNYLKLIFISLILGIPIAWSLMQNWLENYIYHIDIEWWYFAGAGILVASIALLTVSQQALKLSFSNPVKYLKDE
ncbi:MAG: ABC transporter permease [Bacteroidota bacterium]